MLDLAGPVTVKQEAKPGLTATIIDLSVVVGLMLLATVVALGGMAAYYLSGDRSDPELLSDGLG